MKKNLIAIALGSSLVNNSFAEALEEVFITGIRETQTIQLSENHDAGADSAELLRKVPGANFNNNGPVTGIAQLRGMFGSRVAVNVNGQSISAGGPNWMDPPLSYAPAAMLDSMTIYRGIAPVGAAQETIGGAIDAQTWSGDYSNTEKMETSGRVRMGTQSVNKGAQLSAATSLANNHHKFLLALLSENADDAEFPDGDITPTEYERQRLDLGYGYRGSEHQLQLEFARNETGDSGTPALPMDIQYIDSSLGNIRYGFENTNLKMETRLYASDIEHGMTNYDLRAAPMMNNMWRRNIATGENQGMLANIQFSNWKMGLDYHRENHNSNIDNIHNPAFFVVNFNNASRTVAGVFSEYRPRFADSLDVEFGLRINKVSMKSDQVNGTPSMMMPAAQSLRDNFNNSDRHKSDTNIDAVAKVFFPANSSINIYAGVAQKSRSPSYQERYLWLPMEATAGLADGRTYIGNIELKPEVATEIEMGVDLNAQHFTASPRMFYRQVKDYIQGTPTANMQAQMVASMMGSLDAPLEFNNVDASFYGFDMDWRWNFTSSFYASGIVNYVRGKRDDIDDNLYRIAPINTSIAFNLERDSWSISLETLFYASQNHVSNTQGEKKTTGYGTVNLQTTWKVITDLQLKLGLNNLLNKKYQDHLAGYNRVTDSDIPLRERLPGYGRNAYLQLNYAF